MVPISMSIIQSGFYIMTNDSRICSEYTAKHCNEVLCRCCTWQDSIVNVYHSLSSPSSSRVAEYAYGNMWTDIAWKPDYVKLESVRTVLRITRSAHNKSYLVIISPNCMKKLTKVKLCRIWVGSNIAHDLSLGPHI